MSTATDRPTRPIGRCQYRGRDYAILWTGPTKYGERMKLAFPENFEETFWINAGTAEAVRLYDVDEQPRRQQSSKRRGPRRPPYDQPRRGEQNRRRREQPGDELEQIDQSADEQPDAETCYCASCGQRLPDPEVPF